MKIISIYIASVVFLILLVHIIFYGGIFDINSLQLSANNILIYLIPAIIINIISKGKHNYIGITFNKTSVIEIITGLLLSSLSIGVITFILWVLGDIKYAPRNYSFNILWMLNDATVEELVFRGFIFQYIYKHYPNIIIPLISSLLFTCSHFFIQEFNILLFINILIAGLLFAFMYIKTKSLWMPISFHFVWNTLQLFILNNLFIFNDNISNSFEPTVITTIILLINLFIILKYSKKFI